MRASLPLAHGDHTTISAICVLENWFAGSPSPRLLMPAVTRPLRLQENLVPHWALYQPFDSLIQFDFPSSLLTDLLDLGFGDLEIPRGYLGDSVQPLLNLLLWKKTIK